MRRKRGWESVEQKGDASRGNEWLDDRQRFEEMLMMGLRLQEGVALEAIVGETGRALEGWIEQKPLEQLVAAGYLTRDDQVIRTSEEGRERLDAILAHLLGDG